MLKIDQSTTKQSLFKMLEQSTQQVGDLEILIDSLPAFMSTPIALNIFSYQVDKYPRKLIWKCQDKETAEMLQSCGFHVTRKATIQPVETNKPLVIEEPNQVETNPKVIEQSREYDLAQSTVEVAPPNHKTTAQNEAIKQHIAGDKQTTSEKPSQPHPQFQLALTPPQTVETKKPQATIISLKKNINERKSESAVNEQIKGHGKNLENSCNEFNSWQTWFNPRDRLNKDSLTKNYQYQPSSLLGDAEAISSEQDFDKWLHNVHNAKAAIDNLRNKQSTGSDIISSDLIKKNRRSRQQSLSKNFQLITGAVLTTCLLILFLLVFPTNVYTVEIESPLLEESTEVNIPVSDFSQKPIVVSTNSEIDATGRKEVETVNATGSAILVNQSGNAINLTNGGFYLVANGQRYKHEFDANLPRTIVVPSRNDLNGPRVEIEVRAVQEGAGANQPEDTRFSVINLKEQNVGNALFGLAVTPIQNKELSGDRVVTQSDLDLLATTNEGEIAQEIGREISNIQEEGIFTNPEWYVRAETDQEYNASVGDTKPEVSLATTTNLTLYYLPQEIIANKIKTENDKVEEVTEVLIKEQDGDFADPANQISLDIFYSYLEATEIDTNSVSQTLAKETDFVQAEQKLKEQYPYIKSIDKQEIGVQMPMVQPKIDINVVE